MRLAQVKKLSPFEVALYWIKERHGIYVARKAGKPKPWTDDQILQSYRFCNVRRMNDKVSQWLLKEWYTPHHGHFNMLVAATLARQLNNPESLAALGFPLQWDPARAEEILNKRAAAGLKNFSGAYMITGTLGGTKVQQVVHKVVTPIYEHRPVIDSTSMEASVNSLLPCAGFSTFIAGQVVADLRWGMNGTWEDKLLWAPIGPGSRRGMNRMLGKPIDTPMNQKQFNNYLAAYIVDVKKRLPTEITHDLEAIDYQNTLCEVDKYIRTLLEEGTPKQKYPGA